MAPSEYGLVGPGFKHFEEGRDGRGYYDAFLCRVPRLAFLAVR
jgi:hypothetical protein